MPGVNPDSEITRPVAYFDGSISRPVRDHSPRKSQPSEAVEARLELTDPAIHVVTDFVWEPPVTVREEITIDDALREMIRAGVRALLVVRDEVVTGLITSYDIQGERPLQFLAESGYRRHDEIEVRSHHDPVGACSDTRLAGTRPRAGIGSGRVFQDARRRPMSWSSSMQIR